MDLKVEAKIREIAALADHAKKQLARTRFSAGNYLEIMISADALGLSQAACVIRASTGVSVDLREVLSAVASVGVFKRELDDSFLELHPESEFHKLRPILATVYEAVDEIAALLHDQ